MKTLKFLWVILFTLVFSEFQSVNSEFTEPVDSKTLKYYKSLEGKLPLLNICDGVPDGIKYQMSPPIKCEIQPVHDATALNMTIFIQDRSDQVLEGWECYKTSQEVRAMCGFFESSECEKRFGEEQYSEVGLSECWNMVKNEKHSNGQELKLIQDGYYGTSNLDFPKEKWWETTNITRENYYAVRHVLSVDDINQSIQTYAPTRGTCPVEVGNCLTTRGILVWDQNNITLQSCRLDESKTTPCVFSGDQISCPDINMALTGITTKEMCGVVFYYNNQKVLFTTPYSNEIPINNGATILPPTTKTDETRTILRSHGRRSKREINDDDTFGASEAAYKFQFVYNLIKNGVDHVVQMLHLETCHVSRFAYDLLVNSARSSPSGDISVYAQTMLSDPNVRAKFNGDVVSIWKCEEISNYFFSKRTTCTIEAPVKYQWRFMTFDGYLKPGTHEIVSEPTPCNGKSPPFYFQTPDGMLLVDEMTWVNVPILPQPLGNIQITKLDSWSFPADAWYSSSGLSSRQNTTYRMMKTHVGHINYEKTLEKLKYKLPIEGKDEDNVNFLREVILGPWMSFLTNTASMVFGVVLIIVALLFLVNLGPVLAIVKSVLNAISAITVSLFDRITRRFKKKPEAGKSKRYTPRYEPQYDVDARLFFSKTPTAPSLYSLADDYRIEEPATSHWDSLKKFGNEKRNGVINQAQSYAELKRRAEAILEIE